MSQIQLKKLDIIELIVGLNDGDLLERIEKQAILSIKNATTHPNPFDAVSTIRENISLEKIMAEQSYKPIDYNTFSRLAKEIELNDPIDELLADLKA